MDNKIKELKVFIKRIEEDTNLDSNIKSQYLKDMRDIVDNMIFDHNREQEGYFIAINDFGFDDNCTRFYTVLGIMNRADAIKINEGYSDDSGYSTSYNDGVREVSEKEYALWYALACYSEILDLSKKIHTPMLQLSEVELNPIKQKFSELRRKLGLNYSWQVVSLYHQK